MRFLIDAQLPPALARLLNDRGHVGEHVNDIGLGGSPDRDLWRYALDHGAVIVTKDEDFANMAALGERWMGCARNQRDFVFVAWGAGIGAGLVVGGRLHHGHQWFAGEIGHLHLDYREWNSDFGDRGYLETRVGASGIARLVDPGSDPARLFAAAAAELLRTRTTRQPLVTSPPPKLNIAMSSPASGQFHSLNR